MLYFMLRVAPCSLIRSASVIETGVCALFVLHIAIYGHLYIALSGRARDHVIGRLTRSVRA